MTPQTNDSDAMSPSEVRAWLPEEFRNMYDFTLRESARCASISESGMIWIDDATTHIGSALLLFRRLAIVRRSHAATRDALREIADAAEAAHSGRHNFEAAVDDVDTCNRCLSNFRNIIHYRMGESKQTDIARLYAAGCAAREILAQEANNEEPA